MRTVSLIAPTTTCILMLLVFVELGDDEKADSRKLRGIRRGAWVVEQENEGGVEVYFFDDVALVARKTLRWMQKVGR